MLPRRDLPDRPPLGSDPARQPVPHAPAVRQDDPASARGREIGWSCALERPPNPLDAVEPAVDVPEQPLQEARARRPAYLEPSHGSDGSAGLVEDPQVAAQHSLLPVPAGGETGVAPQYPAGTLEGVKMGNPE